MVPFYAGIKSVIVLYPSCFTWVYRLSPGKALPHPDRKNGREDTAMQTGFLPFLYLNMMK
ncbi:hypothetical protein DDI_3996 [Dickeya dianthicola RNS04.9]|nr:hypothetical protein DDI_3996 [Dickeya dianthicola RNS04.9]